MGIRPSPRSGYLCTSFQFGPPHPPYLCRASENVREVEVSTHPWCCAQMETSHPPPPSNASLVADIAPSFHGATLSHPLPSGWGQIWGQLVPPVHRRPSDGSPVLDQISHPAGVFLPNIATASSGLAQVSQPLVTQAFALWPSFAGGGGGGYIA